MKKQTDIVTLGRHPEAHKGVVNPPVYHASTILFPTMADLDAAAKGTYPHSAYGRFGTESTRALEATLASLEGADHAILASSGVAAYTTALLAFLSAGDHLLITDSVYEPARRLCDQELARLGIETTYYDPTIGAKIADLIHPNTKVIYVESPGSITFEVQDIPAIADAAHKKGAIVIADTTWSASTFCRPYDLGADVTLYSASKYMGGHSDLIMGVITCKKECFAAINRVWRNTGPCPGPDDVYLLQRGMRTLAARLPVHEKTAHILVDWLKTRPEVTKILHPAYPDCPGHDLWKRDFTGASGLFSFLIKPVPREALATMMDNMELFKMGWSWGGYESLLIPPPKIPRTAVPWSEDVLLLRIHAGLEHPDDLIADLKAGFDRLSKKS